MRIPLIPHCPKEEALATEKWPSEDSEAGHMYDGPIREELFSHCMQICRPSARREHEHLFRFFDESPVFQERQGL